MAVNNPVALPLLLTITSLILIGFDWQSISDENLPLWWSLYGHAIWYVPKWIALLLFPFLQILIPYMLYQVASHDPKLQNQSGESAYAVANIIALPAVLIFVESVLVIVPSALSDSHDFIPRIFSSNIAIWALFWLGYNLQYVDPNTSIGVPVFFSISLKELWATAHRRAGRVLMVAGIILLIFVWSCPIGIAYFVVTLVIWLGSYVLVILDSYMISRYVETSSALDEPLVGGV